MQLKLSELMNGGLQERVEHELSKVIKNIKDPNTKAGATRTVSIKLTFKPWDDRETVQTDATVTSSLAPYKKIESMIVVGENQTFGCDAVEIGKGDLFQREIDVETGEIIDNPNLKNVSNFTMPKVIGEE